MLPVGLVRVMMSFRLQARAGWVGGGDRHVLLKQAGWLKSFSPGGGGDPSVSPA